MNASDRIPEVLDALERAIAAALELARQLAAARTEDPDEWTRFPAGRDRCHISGLSRTAIYRLCNADKVRRKAIGGAAYYSGTDVRRYLREA